MGSSPSCVTWARCLALRVSLFPSGRWAQRHQHPRVCPRLAAQGTRPLWEASRPAEEDLGAGEEPAFGTGSPACRRLFPVCKGSTLVVGNRKHTEKQEAGGGDHLELSCPDTPNSDWWGVSVLGSSCAFSTPQTSGDLTWWPYSWVSYCLFRTELLTSKFGFGGKPHKGDGP